MMLKKILVSVCLLFVTCINLQAQADYTLTDSSVFDIQNCRLLADKGYSFQQILQDTILPFVKAKTFATKGEKACWVKLKVHNPYPYDKSYAIFTTPPFSNTFFNLDDFTNQWKETKAGYFYSNQSTVYNYAPYIFKSNATTTLYIKVGTEKFTTLNYQLPILFTFENLDITHKNANQRFVWWSVTACIIFAFFLYNLYLYFMFKDAVYIYYLLILVGGFCYITAYHFYCSFFSSFKLILISILPDGSFNYWPFDRIIMQLATAIILSSFLLFTQSYLHTKFTMPFWNKVLKIALWLVLMIFIGITLSEIFGWLPIVTTIPAIFNITSIIVLVLMLLVACIGVRKKITQATYYLLAQTLPLLLMIVLAVWMFVNVNQSWALNYLPNLALLAQTITFAIALVARVNLLKDELHVKKIISEQAISQLVFEQEKNQRLQDKVEHDKKEIAAAQQIKLLMKELHHRVKNNLQIVSSLLSLQSFRIKDKIAADAVREGQHRIEAMSLIHQRLYTTDNITEVNIKEYITDLSESLMQAYGYNKNEFNLILNITNELMNVDKAIPLSLIINELVTNAFKYAFTKEIIPQLTIALHNNNGMMELVILDNGKGIDKQVWATNTGSYGKELVHTFTKQLNGTITMSNQNGAKFTLYFPL